MKKENSKKEKLVCSNTGLEECFCQEPNIRWITKKQYRLKEKTRRILEE